jgi:hypothetical protein
MKNVKALALAVVVAPLLIVAVTAQERSRAAAELTVHEWGTFTSIAGSDGRAMEWRPLSGPSELPCFVQEMNPNNLKVPRAGFPGLRATVRMETPVVYFYAPAKQTVRVRVDFPHGIISEWYPRAKQSALGALDWTQVALVPGMPERFPTEAGNDSHYYAARKTDAVPVRVGDQQEKFLFYRGIASFDVPVSATVARDGSIAVRNSGVRPIQTFIFFERRGARLGYRIVSSGGGNVTIARPPLTGRVEHMREDLRRLLVAQGLYPREAAAMVETWRDSWFEEGARVFYVLPQVAVDAILPLQIEPQPASVARVFVGRMEVVTPEIKAEVARALRENNRAVLRKYGRFLEPITTFVQAGVAATHDEGKIAQAIALVTAQHPAAVACHKATPAVN